MNLMDYVIEFHKNAERQGPGSDEATKRALSYIPKLRENTKILDIGCGTGAQTMVLARNTNANIVAVDMLQEFLNKLQKKVDGNNLNHRVVTKQSLMDNLDFPEKSFDLIWSEGAIYNIGFEKGLLEWRGLLKDGGYIVDSENSWLTDKRSEEIEQFWTNAYSETDTIDAKGSVIEKCGYDLIAYFVLPENCWMEHYYSPILVRSDAFLEKYNYSKDAKEFIKMGEGIKGDEHNVILTLARMWLTVSIGEISPKDVAAEWAIPRLPKEHAALLEAYRGEDIDKWEGMESEVSALVNYMKKSIETSL